MAYNNDHFLRIDIIKDHSAKRNERKETFQSQETFCFQINRLQEPEIIKIVF